MLNHLAELDLSLLRQINQVWTANWLDGACAAMATTSLFYVPIAVAASAVVFWGNFRARLFLVLVLLNFAVADPLITNGLKHAIARPRPGDRHIGVRLVDRDKITYSHPTCTSRPNSFPSSHVANNAALAALAWAVFGWRAGFLVPWALAMAYSRIYIGAHYPSDALAGMVVGLFNAWLCAALARKIWASVGPLFFPKQFQKNPALGFKLY
jgi:undecaprenyl-diphosphatase